MLWHTLLIVHICAAVTGLLSGFTAMFLRKGSGLHGAAGSVFFVAMVTMTTTAAYIATFYHPIAINVIAALLTLYLVMTARRAAKNRDGRTGMFDVGALLFILAVGVGGIATGLVAASSPTGAKHGIPSAVYFVFGTVALLCAISDIRMLKRGGVIGQQSIVRHLWRMSLALLIATLSFYPGQAKLFPKWFRDTNLLFTPHVLLIGSMLFYKIRVGRRKRLQQVATVVVSTNDTAIAA